MNALCASQTMHTAVLRMYVCIYLRMSVHTCVRVFVSVLSILCFSVPKDEISNIMKLLIIHTVHETKLKKNDCPISTIMITN